MAHSHSERRLLRALKRTAAGVTCSTILALPAGGSAKAEPFSVRGFVTREAGVFVLDEPLYDGFLEDVLGALRPRFGGTGRTSGASGMDLSIGFGWTAVTASSTAWQAAMGDAAPDSVTPLLVAARKGLPGGFELGVQLAYASELDVVSPSLELRWAIVEGHRVFPDIGMRLDAGAVMGNPEATILHAGFDVIIGRSIPVQGLFTVGPYGGYAFRYGRTLERQVAAFDGAEAEPFQTVLPGQNLFLHHAVTGLRFESRPLAINLEAHLGTTQGLSLSLGSRF